MSGSLTASGGAAPSLDFLTLSDRFWRVFGRFSEVPERRTIPRPGEPNRLKKAAIVLIVPKVRAAPSRPISSIALI